MKTWQTGGEEYYIIFKNGTHELRKITSYEDDYIIIANGHWEKLEAKMNKIIENNIDYDYNL